MKNLIQNNDFLILNYLNLIFTAIAINKDWQNYYVQK